MNDERVERPCESTGIVLSGTTGARIDNIGIKSQTPDNCDQIWNAQPPEVPERSKLYSLEPIGVGTGDVESITSYLSRLADGHTVSTWALLRSEIGPRLFNAGGCCGPGSAN